MGEDAVYNFFSSMVDESKYCSDMTKKCLEKQLVMTKKDNEESNKCCIWDNDYIFYNVKVRDLCHITGNYRAFPYRDSYINVKLNHILLVEFHNSKHSDPHLITQELSKFYLKINALPNGSENYMSFSIKNK